MGKVLQAANDSYAKKTLPGGPYTDVWATLEVAWDDDAQTLALGGFTLGDFIELYNGAGSAFEGVEVFSLGTEWGDLWLPTSGGPAPAGETYFTVELHWESSVDVTLIVEGITVGSGAFGSGANVGAISVGQYNSGAIGGLVYIAEVKVGTTQGGGDIFSDDFEDGTTAAWTTTTGTVTVIDDPIAAPPSPPDPVNLYTGNIADRGGNEPLIQQPSE